ncbi:GNAT family N-acetyltransferase [[Clostridium] innocuum]|uniref:N-acetyltransferase n=2 Tax=Clostridium innocuum TaxID=1522 RepID=A0A3E2VXV1_CLOIN|nr:GNAT family N-acetyltransferase [[Clostridium] innocuum]MCQ5279135.1 GNAT family N-acetyltransferase [Clostridium sp. DFI.1.208]RHV66971.1 N-acetyltransferase [Clostridiaceae bacterium OM02-2AC]MCC2850163.1 GNAT family N-acetyltransferase [[Clostridium] innocuum]MCC2854218.1 GNAT family N-acetyltransferase [[Clostridium] innocuum]
MLKTDRCSIYEIKESDMEDVRILFTDKVVRTYLGGAYDTVNADKKLRNMMMAEIDYQGFTVRRTSDSALLGLIEIGPYHNGIEQEISYQFVPTIWGQGYAKEAIQAVLVFLSEQGELQSIVAETQRKNIRSCRLLEALGFKMRESLIRFHQPQMVYVKQLCKHIKALNKKNE